MASCQDQTFPSFPRLPFELRLKIWKVALPGRRVVQAILDHESRERTPRGSTEKLDWFTIKTNQPPPALLHVCHESRVVALEKYNTCLDTISTSSYIRIDPLEDIMYFSKKRRAHPLPPADINLGTIMTPESLERIRYLAADLLYTWPWRVNGVTFGSLKSLERLIIVLHTTTCKYQMFCTCHCDIGKEALLIERPGVEIFPSFTAANAGRETSDIQKFEGALQICQEKDPEWKISEIGYAYIFSGEKGSFCCDQPLCERNCHGP